jgi:meso-butanediol dehydrogenase/(S,S)-butanediol dehydrogenase/diacetyl reductase
MKLNDRVAIVTGGGRGIGRGIVLVLASRGADAVVADLNLGDAEGVAAEVGEMGRKAVAVALDVTDQGSVERMAQQAISRFGRVDILVNNAGVYGAPGIEGRDRPDEEDWDLIYEVNVKGVARVTDAVAPHMKQRRYGRVVNIASIAGREGSPRNPPYNVSKAGVISLTQAQALELAPYDITVNAICPGLIWTPMWERIANRSSVMPNPQGLPPRQVFEEFVRQRIPLGREQTPEDIGYMAAFLASDYARNITGQAINVSGGWFMN